MTRLLRREAVSPCPIRVGGQTRWVCRCGLSRTQPVCDGSHLVARREWPGVLYEYDEANLRRRAIALEPGPCLDRRPGPWLAWNRRIDLLPELPPAVQELCESGGLSVRGASWSDAPAEEIASLRSQLLGPRVAADEHEERCVHVWVERAGCVVGSIRGSIHRYAPIPDAGCYGDEVMRRLGPAACSGTRLVAERCERGPSLGIILMAACWAVGLWYGCRVNVTNAAVKAVRYYRRSGFLPVAGSEFEHPVLGTPSVVLVNPADPRCPGPLGTMFEDRAIPLTAEVVAELLAGGTRSVCGRETSLAPVAVDVAGPSPGRMGVRPMES